MYQRIRFLFLTAFTVSFTSTAYAQNPLILQRLTAWNAVAPQPSPSAIQAQVVKAALAVQKRSGGCVPTSTVVDNVVPATGVRFVFEGILAGQLKNGWIATARHPNCDLTPVRYTISEDSTGALTTIRTNRGLSLANESLISDTWPLAAVQATVTAKRNGFVCDRNGATLGVTRIAKEEPGLGADVFGVRYDGSWTEVWPVELCGRIIEVTVRFTADGDGGAYTDLKGTEARLLPPATKPS